MNNDINNNKKDTCIKDKALKMFFDKIVLFSDHKDGDKLHIKEILDKIYDETELSRKYGFLVAMSKQDFTKFYREKFEQTHLNSWFNHNDLCLVIDTLEKDNIVKTDIKDTDKYIKELEKKRKKLASSSIKSLSSSKIDINKYLTKKRAKSAERKVTVPKPFEFEQREKIKPKTIMELK